MENRKKKIPTSRLAFLGVTQRTGNTFLLKDGLSQRNREGVINSGGKTAGPVPAIGDYRCPPGAPTAGSSESDHSGTSDRGLMVNSICIR